MPTEVSGPNLTSSGVESLPSVFSSASSSTPTTASTLEIPAPASSDQVLNQRGRIAVSVGVPSTLNLLFVLAIIAWLRSRKRKRKSDAIREVIKEVVKEAIGEATRSTEDAQLYFQHKAELEAEEKRRHELEAREMRYEMDNENALLEMEAGADRGRVQTLQELRGPEHSGELGATIRS